jgi:hypothetical protein
MKTFSRQFKWTLQSVVEEQNRSKITARAKEMSSAPSGSVEFLSAFRRARTTFCNELSEEERERYESMADGWNKGMLPVKVQRR